MERHKAQLSVYEQQQRKHKIELPSQVTLQPTSAMRDAKRWLEHIQSPPQRDGRLLSSHGWLSPEGVLYACAWERHDELTRALGYANGQEIEAAGFCKLTQLRWQVDKRYCEHDLTEAQWETIERWYESNDFPYAHFRKLMAGEQR